MNPALQAQGPLGHGHQEVVDQLNAAEFIPTTRQFSDEDVAQYMEALAKDGVVVIPDVYSPETIETMLRLQNLTHDFINEMARTGVATVSERIWVSEFNTEEYLKKVTMVYDNEANLDLGNGRFDYQWGYRYGLFSKPEFYFPSPIQTIVNKLLTKDFYRSSGSLPLAGNQKEPGDWHRDTLNLFDDPNISLQLPVWYLTVLVPLVDVTEENGTTQFIVGSHKKTYEDSKDLPHEQFNVKRGSVVLFDGRIFHRGMPNSTPDVRPVLYTIYVKHWYTTYPPHPVVQ